MTRYKVYFERFYFSSGKEILKQTADVVFDTDIPFDDYHLEEFEKVAWEAMWKQCPHWNDPSPPIEGMAGWSSVLGGRKFEILK